VVVPIRLPRPARCLATAVGAALVITGSGCGGSQSEPAPGAVHAAEHEVFCLGSPVKCDATASSFCRSRYQTEAFTVVRRIPERGSLVVICGAE
jgi:hypothetical protein